MAGSWKIGSVAGIDVRIHPSWLIILGLLTWSLAEGYFPQQYPEFSQGTAWLLGFISALLLFVSVLAHELSHSLLARARGLQVHSITLFVFGGVSGLAGEPARPSTEFLVAISGPVTSFAIGAVCFLLTPLLADASPPLGAIAGYLGFVNVVLGAFNLLPGFPLDGGRVLRATAWKITGSFDRATRIAGGVGTIVGYGLVLIGIWQAFSGNLIGGVWLAVIGWFVASAAGSSTRELTFRRYLTGIRVADVMRREPVVARPTESIEEVAEEYLMGHGLQAVPVAENGHLLGMVTVSDVRSIPRDRWHDTVVTELFRNRIGVETIGPRTPLWTAVRQMTEGDIDRLPVIEDDGRLVGILSRSDVLRYLHVRLALTEDGLPQR